MAQPGRFFQGRPAIIQFLQRKWARELDYRLIKELWAVTGHRIAVRFQYEWHDDSGNWYRAHGNEQWEFDADGLMRRREASINDVPIREADRLFIGRSGPAGGHSGTTRGTIGLVPAMVDAVAPIPVVAVGGIADGRGLAAALALGAAGISMGTASRPRRNRYGIRQ